MSRSYITTMLKVACLFLISFLLISSASQAAENLKVGVIDVEKIYSSYGKAKASSQEIQEKREEKQIELAKKQADLQVLLDEYNQKSETLTEAEKQDYAKKIRDLRTEIITFTRLSNEKLTAENREQTQERLSEIAAKIQDYAKQKNFDIIIDKKSLPFFSEALDLTDEIIKILSE